MNKATYEQHLEQLIKEAEQYDYCMSLHINEPGKNVELLLDTECDHYLEWIPGEGADIGLLRCQETKKVIGICLPLLRNNLVVHHDGPIRINTGFRKKERQ